MTALELATAVLLELVVLLLVLEGVKELLDCVGVELVAWLVVEVTEPVDCRNAPGFEAIQFAISFLNTGLSQRRWVIILDTPTKNESHEGLQA